MKREQINEIINTWLHEEANILIIAITMQEAEHHFKQIVKAIVELQLNPSPIITRYSVTLREKNSVIRMTSSERKKEELLGRPPTFFREINVGSWGL